MCPATLVAGFAYSSAKNFCQPHGRKVFGPTPTLYPLSGTFDFTLDGDDISVPEKGQGVHLDRNFERTRYKTNKALGPVMMSLFAALGFVSNSNADDEIASGFYAATQKSCFEATGQLFHCTGGQCLFQEYQSSVATNQPVTAEVSATIHERTDRSGFDLALGDAVLKYNQSGADTVRVVRSNGRTITTTNLARVDRLGDVTFAFIENGASKDPAFKPQMLSRCEAYDQSQIEQIVANGAPPTLPRIETLVPPGLPLEFEYVDAGNADNAGVLTNIPILATAPREDAYIVEAVPVPGRNPDYPDIMVLWTVSPGTPVPIQFLSYDPVFKAYVDKTTSLLAPNAAPLVDNPGAVPVGTFMDGRPSVFLANGGVDAKPWSGSLDTLLVLNASYQWEDHSSILPKRAGWSHDAAIGQTGDGAVLMYVAKINSEPGAGSQMLRFQASGQMTEVSESVAPPDLAYTKDYLTTVLADINGDGADDLILGGVGRLLAFLNDGTGDFSNSQAESLPRSPLPEVYSPVTQSKNGPRYMSLEPVVSEIGGSVDLIAVATPFYKGFSVQYLKNDGNGHFKDETERFFPGETMSYVSTSDENYVWMKRVFAYQNGSVQDIIARGSVSEETPSKVYLNRNGEYHAGLIVNVYTIENVIEIEGKPALLISNTQSLALMAYPQ